MSLIRFMTHINLPRNINRNVKYYHSNVIDHFKNPRNVGSLDNNKKSVGTGIVGSPACFVGDTIIATADGSKFAKLEDIKEDIPVWSYNIEKKQFEIKLGRVINMGEKSVWKLIFDDGSDIICTEDHKFLMRPFFEYKKNKDIRPQESIAPFKRFIGKQGYWTIERMGSRKCIKLKEYLEIWKFNNPGVSVQGYNIHHKDFSKNNDNIDNLEKLTIAEHRKQHPPTIYCYNCSKYSKEKIAEVLVKTSRRTDAADLLELTHKELYDYMKIYGLVSEKTRKKNNEEIKEITFKRMKSENNPYHLKTKEEKFKFAHHPGPTNGRWIKIENEELLRFGRKLYDLHDDITAQIWQKNAKEKGYPQRLQPRFGSWNKFKEQVLDYNHKIISREFLGKKLTYTLQVEENNNYIALTKFTKNTQTGIIVKNCGDVMKIQIEVVDDIIINCKFKTFGCGSAIAASSLSTQWIKNRNVNEICDIKNKNIAAHLKLPPVKFHCSMLAENAIGAAVKNYKNKNNII